MLVSVPGAQELVQQVQGVTTYMVFLQAKGMSSMANLKNTTVVDRHIGQCHAQSCHDPPSD